MGKFNKIILYASKTSELSELTGYTRKETVPFWGVVEADFIKANCLCLLQQRINAWVILHCGRSTTQSENRKNVIQRNKELLVRIQFHFDVHFPFICHLMHFRTVSSKIILQLSEKLTWFVLNH